MTHKIIDLFTMVVGILHPRYCGWCEVSYLFNRDVLHQSKFRAWLGAFLIKEKEGIK
jgi:hypothetical protein